MVQLGDIFFTFTSNFIIVFCGVATGLNNPLRFYYRPRFKVLHQNLCIFFFNQSVFLWAFFSELCKIWILFKFVYLFIFKKLCNQNGNLSTQFSHSH